MKRATMKSKTAKPKKKPAPAGAAQKSVLRDVSQHLMNTYKRSDMIFTHGRGCYVFDQTGKKYLDFLGGIAVNALGYSHPDLVKTIRREAGRAMHVSNLFHNPFQGPLAAKLAKWSGMDRVFFTNSGSEAIEGAMKLARIAAKQKPGGATKTRFLALEHSFHGRTFGALSITHPVKYREPFEPLVPGVDFVRINDVADLESKFNDGRLRDFHRADSGRRRNLSRQRHVLEARAGTGHPARRRSDRRRNSMRPGPHGA